MHIKLYVNSECGLDTNDGSETHPLATIKCALGFCTQGMQTTILVSANHVEEISCELIVSVPYTKIFGECTEDKMSTLIFRKGGCLSVPANAVTIGSFDLEIACDTDCIPVHFIGSDCELSGCILSGLNSRSLLHDDEPVKNLDKDRLCELERKTTAILSVLELMVERDSLEWEVLHDAKLLSWQIKAGT